MLANSPLTLTRHLLQHAHPPTQLPLCPCCLQNMPCNLARGQLLVSRLLELATTPVVLHWRPCSCMLAVCQASEPHMLDSLVGTHHSEQYILLLTGFPTSSAQARHRFYLAANWYVSQPSN